MSPSGSLLMEPKYLTAAALAWTVVSNTSKNLNPRVSGAGEGSDDDTASLDPIPEIESSHSPSQSAVVKKKHVVPVESRIHPSTSSCNASVVSTSTPTQAKVSAATMRQLESRRRVRSALEHYNHHHNHNQHQHHHKQQEKNSGGATVTSASVRSSPKMAAAVTPQKSSLSPNTPSNKNIKVSTPDTEATSKASPPHTIVSLQPVRFKVKSTTTGTVLRFQCVPTFSSVTHNINERLRRSNGNSFWSSASIMLSSTLDSSTLSCGLEIQFQDAEGDWCTLDNDDDVQDAVQAAAGRKDTMVRLNVKEQDTATRVWQSISSQFTW